jgi:hypothetical protein
MAGRDRKIDRLSRLSPRRATRPRKRQDISTIPEPEHNRLKMQAEAVRNILTHKDSDGSIPEGVVELVAFELEIAPYELLRLASHFEAYHETYPGQPLANAFTPPLPGRTTMRQRGCAVSPAEILSDRDLGAPLYPKKRPHIMTVTDNVKRQRIIAYAARIAELKQLQDTNGGKLPDGELDKAATSLERSPDWIEKQIKHLRAYRASYSSEPNYNDANAFTELLIGRPKGRAVNPEIKKTVEEAAKNTEWPSLNGDATVNQTPHQPVGPRLIYSLIDQKFPDAPSESTVWRIFNDFRQKHPALFAATRNDVEILQKLFPWIKNKVGGKCERGQIDIRPLPIVVNYRGILCTLRGVLIVDDYSDYKPVWDVLPAKRIDNSEEVHSQDYTCRKIRELLAIAILRLGRRFRILYADNGSQFSQAALGSYMQLWVVPEEDPTVLINRRRRRPRGGGNIENELGSLTRFLQFRSGYILEQDYRKSLARMKKIEVPTFEQFVVDFDAFMHNNNNESLDGQQSCYERFEQGRDRGLSLPSAENLAVFALSSRREPRKPDPGGIRFDNKLYVPYRKDLKIYEALADAADRDEDILVRVFEIGEYRMVFFSLDNEITWEFAIDKDTDDVTREQHVKLMRDVERMMENAGSEAALFFKTLLLHDEKPLVLNGLRKRARFELLEDAQNDLKVAEAAPNRLVRPQDITELQRVSAERESEAELGQPVVASSAGKKKVKRAQGNAKGKPTHQNKQQSMPGSQTGQRPLRIVSSESSKAETSQLPDDTDEFLRLLNEALGDDAV